MIFYDKVIINWLLIEFPEPTGRIRLFMVDNGLDAVNEIIEQYKKYNYPMFIVTDEGEPE